MTRKRAKLFIGIDVSKQLLEVAAHQHDYQFRCANKASAFAELLAELIALRPALIVLEATGGLERAVVAALQGAGLPAVVVNPRQVRDFARALGQLAKTDRLDARVLAAFAANMHVLGDVNGDQKVDCTDLALVKASFGKKTGDSGFNSNADVNNDGVINILDLAIVSRQFPLGIQCQ